MKNKTIGRVHPEYVGLFLADCEMRLNRAKIYKARILDEDWQMCGKQHLLLIIHEGNLYRLYLDFSENMMLLNYQQVTNESLNLVSEILLSSYYLQELP